jgi:hypothetical protein
MVPSMLFYHQKIWLSATLLTSVAMVETSLLLGDISTTPVLSLTHASHIPQALVLLAHAQEPALMEKHSKNTNAPQPPLNQPLLNKSNQTSMPTAQLRLDSQFMLIS